DHRELREQVLPLLAHVEQRVFLERTSFFRLLDFHVGDLAGERLVEHAGHMGVLLEAGLDRPEVDLLLLQRGVVAQQLVLTAIQTGDDALDVVLCGLVAAEVVVDLAAERYALEETPTLLHVTRGVQVLDLQAERDEGARDLRALRQRALLQGGDGPIEESAGSLGGTTDLFVAHAADRGDLAFELRRLGLEIGERLDVGVDGGIDTRGRSLVDLDRRACLFGGDGRDGRGWLEYEFVGSVRLRRHCHARWTSYKPWTQPDGGLLQLWLPWLLVGGRCWRHDRDARAGDGGARAWTDRHRVVPGGQCRSGTEWVGAQVHLQRQLASGRDPHARPPDLD